MANEAEEKYIQRMEEEGKERVDEDMRREFKGYLPKYTKENEAKAWKLISSACDKNLSRYPTTLQEDIELLAKDDQEPSLGFNIRNCILYRKGEKDILHYLKDCCDKIQKCVKMT